jgi:hypothetical protein
MNLNETLLAIGRHHHGTNTDFWQMIGIIVGLVAGLIVGAVVYRLVDRKLRVKGKGIDPDNYLVTILGVPGLAGFILAGFFVFAPYGEEQDAQVYAATMKTVLQQDFHVSQIEDGYLVEAEIKNPPTIILGKKVDEESTVLGERITAPEAATLEQALLASGEPAAIRQGNKLASAKL